MKLKRLLNLAVILGVSATCATAGWEQAEAQGGRRNRVLDVVTARTLKEIYGISGASQARKAAAELGESCSLHMDLTNAVASCLPLAQDKKRGFKLCQLQMDTAPDASPRCSEVSSLKHINVLSDQGGKDSIQRVTAVKFKREVLRLKKLNKKDGTTVDRGDIGSIEIIGYNDPYDNFEGGSTNDGYGPSFIYGGRRGSGGAIREDNSNVACASELDESDNVQKKAALLAGVLRGKVGVIKRRFNVKCVNVDDQGKGTNQVCKPGLVYNAESKAGNKCEACTNPGYEVVVENKCQPCANNEVAKNNKCVVDTSDKNNRSCNNPVNVATLFDCKDANNYAEKYKACKDYKGGDEGINKACNSEFAKAPSFWQRFWDGLTTPVDAITDRVEDLRENRPESASDAFNGGRSLISRVFNLLNPTTWISTGIKAADGASKVTSPPSQASQGGVASAGGGKNTVEGGVGADSGGGTTQSVVTATKPTFGGCKDGETGCLCVETADYITCNILKLNTGQSDTNCPSGHYDPFGSCYGG